MPCPPGEWLRDGECLPAGVPPDGCGEGFTHDGDRGCTAILPAGACAPGLMAVPGETRCREVAPCAVGKFGDIPVEPSTEHVDASYLGTDSDGSAGKPWTTIQAAVAAAAPDAIVAIAAGSYPENVDIAVKAVRLWGVCPALVEIDGGAGLRVRDNASGTVVRNLSVSGAGDGVNVLGSTDVRLEELRVHDNAGRGVAVQNDLGRTSVTLRGVLVEQNSDAGVFISGSEVTVEASVVRTTQPSVQGPFGRGVTAQAHTVTGLSSTLLVRGSLVDENHDVGVNVVGSTATVEASVVRATQPDGLQRFGHGVQVVAHPTSGAPSTLSVVKSLIERSHTAGVQVEASEATIESTVILATELDASGGLGHGLNAQADLVRSAPATVVLRTSLIDQNHDVGLFVAAADVTVEASVVRNTQPDGAQRGGRGFAVQAHPMSSLPGRLTLTSSLVDQNQQLGLFIEGSQVTIDASVVRATAKTAGVAGRAMNLQPFGTTAVPSEAKLTRSLIELNFETGVFVAGSHASIETCLIRDTQPNDYASLENGVSVIHYGGDGSVDISATRIERSARAGVSAFGARASVSRSALTCQAVDLNRELQFGHEPTLEDLGGNLCGCPEPNAPCKALSANLEPPQAVEQASP
jgi:hypothetical protein